MTSPSPCFFFILALFLCLALTTAITTTSSPHNSQQLTFNSASAGMSAMISLKLLSWNVRYSPSRSTFFGRRGPSYPSKAYGSDTDGEKPWEIRRLLIADTVTWEDPDICTFQEVLHNQLVDLANLLPQYSHVGVGRNDGKTEGEAVPIFYRRDKFALIAVGNFWLSETPEVPGSKGWDAASPRMVTVARLRPYLPNVPVKSDISSSTAAVEEAYDSEKFLYDLQQEDIFIASTHLDDQGAVSRLEGVKLILQRLEPLLAIKRNLVVLAGDFNSEATDDAYKAIVGEPYHDAENSSVIIDPSKSQPSYLKFIDSRLHFYTASYNDITKEDIGEEVVNIAASSAGLPYQYLHLPYGQTYTWTGFTPDWERTIIDFLMFGNTGAVKTPKRGPPMMVNAEDKAKRALITEEKEENVAKDAGENGNNNSSNKARWIIDRYGVLPTRYEFKPRASDHRPVVVRLSRAV